MMNFSKYEPTRQYPSKSRFGTKYWYKSGKLVASQKYGETIIDQNGNLVGAAFVSGLVCENDQDESAFVAAKTAYYDERSALEAAFKKDLLEVLGMTNHPKAEKLFKMAESIACELSDGTKDEIFHIAEELVDLLTS